MTLRFQTPVYNESSVPLALGLGWLWYLLILNFLFQFSLKHLFQIWGIVQPLFGGQGVKSIL